MGTRSPSSPNGTPIEDAKRKSSDLRNSGDVQLPSLKRSRYGSDDSASDEDRRHHRSQRAESRDEDRRAHRKYDFSRSPDRRPRDRNGSQRDSYTEKRRDDRRDRDRSSRKKDYHSPSEKPRSSRRDSPPRDHRDAEGSDGQSPLRHRHKGTPSGDRFSAKKNEPDREHSDADVETERWESRSHINERTHDAERAVEQKRDYSLSPERMRNGRDYSSSPARKHRAHDHSPSPRRRRRDSRSPLHHRDRGRYDRKRHFDRKERNSSRDDDKTASQDDRDDRASGRNGEVRGKGDRSKGMDRNADLQTIDRDRDILCSDRRAGQKDVKADERHADVLNKYVGDEDVKLYNKNEVSKQKQDGASNIQRNEEDNDSAGEIRKRGRSSGNKDEKDNHRSSKRSHESSRHNKHKSWADITEEDELAEKENRLHSGRSKASSVKTEMQAAGKENKDFKSNIPAVNPNAELLQGRSGGVYIPPFKLAQMMKEIQDKSSSEYQRMTWDALRKSINGLVNKVNASNIKNIIPELLAENLIRGRGLFARSCMKSQMASPLFTHVFAALVAVVNTKFPELGELLLKRVILQFRRALKRNDKPLLLAAARFIAHLVNQQVAHEVVALEVLMVLLENPTDDSVEVSVGFVKECGAILQDLAPQGLHGIFERFRGILHEGEIDKRVQFMIEGLFAIRKAGFQGHPAVIPELDLVEHEDQFTHEISLLEDLDAEMSLDIFKADPNFLENEKKYEDIKRDILGEESSDDDDGEKGSGDSSEDDDDDDEDEDDEEAEFQKMQIKDETETNLVNLRRTIYLTIMSSVDFEEAGHKLLKIKLEPGQEMELNIMLLECCSQERTYLRYYGLLGQRFCMINKVYQENFDICFVKQYSMIHRLETNKLRNVAKFFAHLLGTDALPWNVLGYIKLTEEDTTSSSRIFIKILFQELSEHLGLRKLNEKLSDPDMESSFDGIFPKDNPKNTRFAINFFTSIGLGGITDNLREHLKKMPRLIMQQQRQVASESDSSDSDDASESESSSSESDSESSSAESESESESEVDADSKKRRKRR